jgi:hypothetical protein
MKKEDILETTEMMDTLVLNLKWPSVGTAARRELRTVTGEKAQSRFRVIRRSLRNKRSVTWRPRPSVLPPVCDAVSVTV